MEVVKVAMVFIAGAAEFAELVRQAARFQLPGQAQPQVVGLLFYSMYCKPSRGPSQMQKAAKHGDHSTVGTFCTHYIVFMQ
jgi:hypothetical protein